MPKTLQTNNQETTKTFNRVMKHTIIPKQIKEQLKHEIQTGQRPGKILENGKIILK